MVTVGFNNNEILILLPLVYDIFSSITMEKRGICLNKISKGSRVTVVKFTRVAFGIYMWFQKIEKMAHLVSPQISY